MLPIYKTVTFHDLPVTFFLSLEQKGLGLTMKTRRNEDDVSYSSYTHSHSSHLLLRGFDVQGVTGTKEPGLGLLWNSTGRNTSVTYQILYTDVTDLGQTHGCVVEVELILSVSTKYTGRVTSDSRGLADVHHRVTEGTNGRVFTQNGNDTFRQRTNVSLIPGLDRTRCSILKNGE